MRALRSLAPFLVFAAVYAAIALTVSNSYYQLMMTLVLVWACFGLSWNVLSGYTGLVSFGHAAFFGIGAYTTALGAIHLDWSPWVLVPIAAALGAVAGLLIGLPTFRLRGVYFALAMLAYPLALLYVFEWLGYQEVTLPMKRETPAAFMQFADQRDTFMSLRATQAGSFTIAAEVIPLDDSDPSDNSATATIDVLPAAQPPRQEPPTSSGGGGGGIDWTCLLLGALAVGLRRRHGPAAVVHPRQVQSGRCSAGSAH